MPLIRYRHLIATFALFAALTGCSSFTYNNYQPNLAPDATQPYDLSNAAPAAPIIYFDTYTTREAGLSVHRLLVATHLDGQLLPGAAVSPAAKGFQALKVSPGTHSLQWCWLSKNAIGPGSERCGFKADGVVFKAGQRYVVRWSDAKSFEGQATFVRIHSRIENLDSGEVIFRQVQSNSGPF